jgi:hypothetical protein
MPKKTTLANKRSKLRIKPITRKQALSYNMTATPNRARGRRARANGMGVTAISAVNGRGAYDANYQRRYTSTLAALKGRSSTPNGDAMFYYRNAKKKGAAKAAPKRTAATAAGKKYPRGKSPKQQENLRFGRMALAAKYCDVPVAELRYPNVEYGQVVKAKPGSKKAKANRAASYISNARRRAARRNGVASYISNARRNVVSFSEWSKSMKHNRRRRRVKRNPLAQALANARRRRRARANYAPGVGSVEVKAHSRRLKVSESEKAAKKAAPKKAAKKSVAKKSAAKKSASKKAAAKQAKANRRRRALRNLAQAAANRRRRVRRNIAQAAANKRRRRVRRNIAQAAANKRRRRRVHANRRRRHVRRNGIASYISNIGADQIVDVLKQGALIGGGLLAHKVLTNLLCDNVDALKSMKAGKSICGVAVAAVGIPAAAMLVPGEVGKSLAVGMGAALIHTALVDVLSLAGQSKIASMLGDYTEASQALPAAGYGAYYEFSPGEQYSGMGAYYEFSPGEQYSGMGEYIEQGTAGFGDYAQAAAGFGSPMLAQAAAGVGEYIVQGAEGIGEYEQVTPEYSAPAVTREGIAPSLSSAEAALSMAEAAAGVGGFGNVDANLQQIVYPKGQSLTIADDPGGSRSGLFYGGNGVFGP